MAAKITIGIDLDNTLACYDRVFHSAAVEAGLIDSSVPVSKEKVRDSIRLIPNGEAQWTRLQAAVYGPGMGGAELFEGTGPFLRLCAAREVRAFIVSHKTQYAMLDGAQVDLRASAKAWMEAQGFFDPNRYRLSPEDVFFESTRLGKIERIRSLGCTDFIDDLVEVFSEDSFPGDVNKILFAPHGATPARPDIQVYETWRMIKHHFFV